MLTSIISALFQGNLAAEGLLVWVLGYVLGVMAILLGAPFWFDTLSKFVNIRGAGTPPDETKKSAPQPARK